MLAGVLFASILLGSSSVLVFRLPWCEALSSGGFCGSERVPHESGRKVSENGKNVQNWDRCTKRIPESIGFSISCIIGGS